jgi:hypothetical protein
MTSKLIHSLIVSGLLLVSIPALAAPWSTSRMPVPLMVAQQQEYSLDQMAARVRQQTGGKILSAEEVRSNGERHYRFKVNTDGRIRVIRVLPDGSPLPGRR